MPDEAKTLEVVQTICGRLEERAATLFLGAGVNGGLVNEDGEAFPLGKNLSDWIARDLLNEPGLETSLEEAAEMARYRLGELAVNDYLFKRFSTFRPGTAHLALVQLPWDVIYTTNFDTLIEEASKSPTANSAGKLRPILSMHYEGDDLSTMTEEDIPYYKLHGSVDLANTKIGRLVLTKDDYRFYDRYRRPLFKRLARDLSSRTFVFVGYSLADDNFRAILDDCRTELGALMLPRSYAVQRSFSSVQEVFWLEKYNIQLVSSDAPSFLEMLKETWIAESRSNEAFHLHRPKDYVQADGTTRFPKVLESYFQIRPTECNGQPDPRLFFLGAEATWADIRDHIPAERDAFWPLSEAIFPELAEPNGPPGIYLITGAAGTGKTTLIRSIAFDLARGLDVTVLEHIPGTPLEAQLLGTLVDPSRLKRIVVIIRHAADNLRAIERFIEDAKRLALPLTLILEERRNQWNVASSAVRSHIVPAEYELGTLSEQEVDRILDQLSTYGGLGKLAGISRDYQRSHFMELAHKELLVALRELTSLSSFDEYVRDEFNKIPSERAKQAYVYVATVGQLNLALRYEILIRILHLSHTDLNEEIFKPTERVLISTEESGGSRHNAGFRLETRHPVIASIIFAMAAPDDDAKVLILNNLLTQLDTGFIEDYRLLREITRGRELISTIASAEKRRGIYDLLAELMPDDPYVLRQRSILERELGAAEKAVEYARLAVRLDKNNAASLNTLGLALELQARTTEDPMRRQALVSEASRLFEDGIQRDPADPFGYLGRVYLGRQMIERERDRRTKALMQADMLSQLEDAYEATDESDVIASQLATQKKQLGTTDEAITILQAGIDKAPANTRLRDLLIRYVAEGGELKKALDIALEGGKIDPTSWRLQRHIARLQRNLGGSVDSVKGYYEAAIRHHKGDLRLRVELGAYLFMNGEYSAAAAVFGGARDLPIPNYLKRQVTEHWRGDSRQDAIFAGKVWSISGASGYVMAVPQNFRAFFWRTDASLGLRENDDVRFSVGFNAFGALAHIILEAMGS